MEIQDPKRAQCAGFVDKHVVVDPPLYFWRLHRETHGKIRESRVSVAPELIEKIRVYGTRHDLGRLGPIKLSWVLLAPVATRQIYRYMFVDEPCALRTFWVLNFH